MKPKFWKLSQGTTYFSHEAILQSISQRLVYVHKDTKAKGISSQTQGRDFIDASTGDYFYLTHGNTGVYVLGQFSGPANVFSTMGGGWLDRPFRQIRLADPVRLYTGPRKWWAPSDNSTFTVVPETEIMLFEQSILYPHFGISLKDFGIQ